MSLHGAVSEALFIEIFFLLASLPCFQMHHVSLFGCSLLFCCLSLCSEKLCDKVWSYVRTLCSLHYAWQGCFLCLLSAAGAVTHFLRH